MADRVRLLVVDDDPLVRQALAASLRPVADVVLAIGADEALAALERLTIDAILTDRDMPDGDGVALLETVRATYPHVKRLLMSDGAPRPNVGAAEAVQACVDKPFTPSDVRAALDSLDD